MSRLTCEPSEQKSSLPARHGGRAEEAGQPLTSASMVSNPAVGVHVESVSVPLRSRSDASCSSNSACGRVVVHTADPHEPDVMRAGWLAMLPAIEPDVPVSRAVNATAESAQKPGEELDERVEVEEAERDTDTAADWLGRIDDDMELEDEMDGREPLLSVDVGDFEGVINGVGGSHDHDKVNLPVPTVAPYGITSA
jgi:hypothetical protein